MSFQIADYELMGNKGGGEDFPVRVALFKPQPSEKIASAWSCTVTVAPLWEQAFEIYGEGSLQALCLAAKHAIQLLNAFVEQGGVLKYRDGEVFDPATFGFELLPVEKARN
ncbi:hypothetical protein [Massilia sp. TS11]|uniref:DUF6968 family protein n=1 Tax=Massilia sp. TS11 TaxID=2908003 RepID=UPI001EDB78CB|nr:hypothetical protein [Massilia sp. TS11]MCG2584167.1 hypothetical protein [Massilia sp. TS11]